MTKPHGMFWSSDTLSDRLPPLIIPYDPKRVDCAAYTLSVGPEVYVSPSDQAADPTTVTVRKITQDEAFTIPPGQFAFLITEEIVTVPGDALAFISIRAKTKFRGLVNVSGFHVDPGYKGQITFAVFNAGPVPIHLKRGQPIFLIWYASLDQESSSKKDGPITMGIDTALITGIAGELQSFASLAKKINNVNEALTERIHAVEKSQASHRTMANIALAILVGLMIGLAVHWISNWQSPRPLSSLRPAVSTQPTPSP